MEIIIGALVVVVILQKIENYKLVQRLLLQANVPQSLGPVRVPGPIIETSEPVKPIDTRRKLFSSKIPW